MGIVGELRKMGYEVKQFSAYHFRVNGKFDFWLPRGKWFDLVTLERGRKPLDQLVPFIHDRLTYQREEAVRNAAPKV